MIYKWTIFIFRELKKFNTRQLNYFLKSFIELLFLIKKNK